MIIRYIAIIFLSLSGFAAYTVDKFGQDLCIYEYLSVGTITYFKDLNGVSSNDPSLLGMCGVLAIVVSMVLLFIKNKYLYAFVVSILIFLELILLNMMETVSYKEIIYDSIVSCFNYSVLVWFLSQFVFFVISGFYLFRQK